MQNENTKKLLRTCPICLNNDGEILHTQSFSLPEEHPLPNSYDIVACSQCGFVFADSPAHQNDYNLFYKDFSKYEYSNMEGEGLKNDEKRLKRTVDDISSVITDKSAKILDIGCAEGDLLLELKNRGYTNLMGLDPSQYCVSHINNEHKIDANIGGLFSLTSVFNENEFDCVILSHVFEHIYDLSIAIQNIYSILKDDGILYLEVPDASRYFEYYIVPFHYFDIEHINHFDEHSLKYLASKNGFEPIILGKKEFKISERNIYPAVYGFFKKLEKKGNYLDINYNFECKTKIEDYIKKSRENDVFPEINDLADSGDEIVIWGAGSYTARLLESTSLGNFNIVALVDSDPSKHGAKLKNIKVYSPSILKRCNKKIVISSAIYSNEILKQIKKMGLKNDLIVIKHTL